MWHTCAVWLYVKHSQIWFSIEELWPVKCIRPRPQSFGNQLQKMLSDSQKQTRKVCSGSSKYGIYKVWWRLDEICANRSKKCVYQKFQNGPKKFPGANGCGLYQSHWHRPRNTLCKYCFAAPHGSWVSSQNVKHVITDHMAALLVPCFNTLSFSTWDTCPFNMNTLALSVFEISTFKHSSHRLSIINFTILKNIYKITGIY